MINLSEIRIGNYYKYPNSKPFIVELKDMGESSFLFEDDDIIESIPLREEILLACGFEKRNNDFHNFNRYNLIKNNTEKCFDVFIGGEFIAKVYFLHHLQNFNFIITGEEIEFKTATLEC